MKVLPRYLALALAGTLPHAAAVRALAVEPQGSRVIEPPGSSMDDGRRDNLLAEISGYCDSISGCTGRLLSAGVSAPVLELNRRVAEIAERLNEGGGDRDSYQELRDAAIALAAIDAECRGTGRPDFPDGTVVADSRWTYLEDESGLLLDCDDEPEFAGVEAREISYMSSGLAVRGFVLKPDPMPEGPRPVIYFNRGGNRDFGKARCGYLAQLGSFVRAGYVIVGTQYRGNDGGEGREEFGGADVNDTRALEAVADGLGYGDRCNRFMMGVSRGGMQSYLAMADGMRVNAAGIISGLADLHSWSQEREGVKTLQEDLIPGFAEADAGAQAMELTRRSAILWADAFRDPILILHSREDRAIGVGQARALDRELTRLGRRHRYVEIPGADHGLGRAAGKAANSARTPQDDAILAGRNRLLLQYFERYRVAPSSCQVAREISP